MSPEIFVQGGVRIALEPGLPLKGEWSRARAGGIALLLFLSPNLYAPWKNRYSGGVLL